MHTDELITVLASNTPTPRTRYLCHVGFVLAATLLAAIGAVVLIADLRQNLADVFSNLPMFNKYGFTFGMLVASGVAWWWAGQPGRSVRGPLMFIALFCGWQLVMCVQSFFVSDFSTLQAAVMNPDGIRCSLVILALGVPVTYVLMRLNRAMAPLDTDTHGYLTGLFAASISMFAFSLHCNHDEPLYMAVWYVSAVVLSVFVYGRIAARKAAW